MKIIFDTNKPIYLQIMSRIKKQLANGSLAPGERIASVRDLAAEYGVNPNTMQKALSELEREGFLISERTAGRGVTTDTALLEALKQSEYETAVSDFIGQTDALGIPRETLPGRLSEYLSELNNKGVSP